MALIQGVRGAFAPAQPVDPDVLSGQTEANICDTYVSPLDAPGQNSAKGYIRIGNNGDGYGARRAMFRVKSLPTLNGGAVTQAFAKLRIKKYNSESQLVDVYKIPSTWNTGTVTWNNTQYYIL